MKIRDDKERLVIAGTGHRSQKLNPQNTADRQFGFTEEGARALSEATHHALHELEVLHPGKEFTVISGMALGFDQALAEAALERKMHVIAAIPFPGQDQKWRPDSQRQYRDLLDRIRASGGEVRIISEGGYSSAKMQTRNSWMVDHANLVLALHNGSSGGTENCIAYAREHQKEIKNIWGDYVQAVSRVHDERRTPAKELPPAMSKQPAASQQIEVVHVNDYASAKDDSFIYIGRSNAAHNLAASPLANPYHIGPDGSREEVIEKYQAWLRAEFSNPESPARQELLRIKDLTAAGRKITLGCWCAPRACHGDVIRDAVSKLREREQSHQHQQPPLQAAPAGQNATQEVHQSPAHHEVLSGRSAERTSTAVPLAGFGEAERETWSPAGTEPSSRLAQQAQLEIVINHDQESLVFARNDGAQWRALYQVTDGLSRAEHASQLNELDPLARDQFERGAYLNGNTLVVPKEFDTLPPEQTITTRHHAFKVIHEFLPDEDLAKEQAGQLVDLAEQIGGRWADNESRIALYRHLYSQITEDAAGRRLPIEERSVALEKTLDNARILAQEMQALEPTLPPEEHQLSEELPEHEHGGRFPLDDENTVYAEIFEQALEESVGSIEHETVNPERGAAQDPAEAEQEAEHDHLEVDLRTSAAFTETAYERTSLAEMPPVVPGQISLDELEHLLTDVLPAVDRALESGVSPERIMRGEILKEINIAHARDERAERAAAINALFSQANAPEVDSSRPPTREELIRGYTTLSILATEGLRAEGDRFSEETFRQAREFYSSEREETSQKSGSSLSDRSALRTGTAYSPATAQATPAQDLYYSHEKEIRLYQQNFVNLSAVPTRADLERMGALENSLHNIRTALDRLDPSRDERALALASVEARAAATIKGENGRLAAYREAETSRAQVESRLLKPLAYPSLTDYLMDERAQAQQTIREEQTHFLRMAGFLPNSPREAEEYLRPYLAGLERTRETIADSRSQPDGSPSPATAEKAGPVFVSLAAHPNVRLPLSSPGEYRAVSQMAEATHLTVTPWHGLAGREIAPRDETRQEITRFVGQYINFRMRNPETRRLNESPEYRFYTERLNQVRTMEELRVTSREIRQDNYRRGQQLKAHRQDPQQNRLPPLLDPEQKSPPRSLTPDQMRFLFSAQAPEHYTDEMRAYRQGLSEIGKGKERRTEALRRGELAPSKQLGSLLEELGRRKTEPSLAHYTRSLLKPASAMDHPSSFDLHAVHEQLLPYERDYLFQVMAEKRDAFRARYQQQVHLNSPPAENRAPERRPAIKELSSSRLFKDYYVAANWREAELMAVEISRRTDGFPKPATYSSIVKGVSDRNIDAAAYLLHNLEPRQQLEAAQYLRAKGDERAEATAEIIEHFSAITRSTTENGRTELSLQVPQGSSFTDKQWVSILNHIHPDDASHQRFLRGSFPESLVTDLRREAQVSAWSELEPQIRAASLDPDSRAEVLTRALEVRSSLEATKELQATARTAHYALEDQISACARTVEERLLRPGSFLSHETVLRLGAHATKVGSFLASYAGQAPVGKTLARVSEHFQQSAEAAAHVGAQKEAARGLADRQLTRELVKAHLDPEYARSQSELIKAHANEYQFIQHAITPKQERRYSELKEYGARSKQEYLNSFIELDRTQKELAAARELDAQQPLHAPTQAAIASHSQSEAAHDFFMREYEDARQQLTGAEVEKMIQSGELQLSAAQAPEKSIWELLSKEQQLSIAAEARATAWWNMVPPEVRGEELSITPSAEVMDHAFAVSDAVSDARLLDRAALTTREELAHLSESERGTGAHSARVDELTERLNSTESQMRDAFSLLDHQREALGLARQEQLLERHAQLFHEVRPALEERMVDYLEEAFDRDGLDAFRDPALSEQHTDALAQTIQDCVEEQNLTLADLNLRHEDVTESAHHLVTSLATTLEHRFDQNYTQEMFRNTPDYLASLQESVQLLSSTESRFHSQEQHLAQDLSLHAREEHQAQDVYSNMTSQPRSVDKEQAEGVRGMETVEFDQDRVNDHLEHVHDLVEVLIH